MGVIKQGRSAGNIDDFRDEFHSYWDRARTENSIAVVSTLSDFSAPRTISAWFGKNMIVVGDSDESVSAWMDNQLGKTHEKRSYGLGALLNLTPRSFRSSILVVFQTWNELFNRST